jgi:hypothetical protein
MRIRGQEDPQLLGDVERPATPVEASGHGGVEIPELSSEASSAGGVDVMKTMTSSGSVQWRWSW